MTSQTTATTSALELRYIPLAQAQRFRGRCPSFAAELNHRVAQKQLRAFRLLDSLYVFARAPQIQIRQKMQSLT